MKNINVLLICFVFIITGRVLSQEPNIPVNNSDTLNDEHIESDVVPVPTQTPSQVMNETIEERNRRLNEEEVKKADRKAYKVFKELGEKYDPNFEPIVDPNIIPTMSPHKEKKMFGRQKRFTETPPEKRIPGCMYVPTFRDPDICLDENGKEIYRKGKTDKNVLQELKKKYGRQ
jgi:hypothetical protein